MILSTGRYNIKKIESFGEFVALNNGTRLQVEYADKPSTLSWSPMSGVNVDDVSGKKVRPTHAENGKTIGTTIVS
ncbi:hypothetical protein RP726_11065 [Candidatus Methylospira mobilis]|uniref:hypothetical protein n=1 Tax=Candidatus Methylospira mobilis TaxID=1808979 RepID=UPI0028F085E1|nr:hypothetical protein [Candidatus Methylospira mobilis]WNV03012.1 hypothetical protein RP726_11065 [Candidatus Methylospira mobilis]